MVAKISIASKISITITAMPYINFTPDVKIKAKNDIVATFNALWFDELAISSPINAPKNGPTITPIGPKKSPTIVPMMAPFDALFEPPLYFVNHAGAI